jgi:hypothetical protein
MPAGLPLAHHMISITEDSMPISIHASMDTPDLDAVGPIDEDRATAQSEVHRPRPRGVFPNPCL